MVRAWQRQIRCVGLSLICLMGMIGCTKTFVVHPVTTSELALAGNDAQARSIQVDDARQMSSRPLNTGTLKVELDGMSDEIAYLRESLGRVLQANGIQANFNGASADATLKVHTYRIRNLRTSGFSPYHTFTTFSADLITAQGSQRITAYFKGSKTPVWAFSEVERPCYQIPIDVTVKEIAAKLNAHLFHRQASLDQVRRIEASINPTNADAASEQYLKVLDLGYTNNPAAIEPLLRFAKHDQIIMRAAAVSALGTLGAKDQFELLKTVYEQNDDESIVKLMALKSIGDLDGEESHRFLSDVRHSKPYADNEMIREVADLYP